MGTQRIGAILLLAGTVSATSLAQEPAPEEATGRFHREAVTAGHFMVAAANPHAARAGYDVLVEGGSAIDAMVAVQMMLTLVEPQSSGIGGGAFLVYHQGEDGAGVTTFDGRETAPLAADGALFLDEAGERLGFWDAVVGGRSVGTPGTLALMWETHQRYGRLDWARLLAPTIALAEAGFDVSPRLAGLLEGSRGERLQTHEPAAGYFFPGGTALAAGDILRNPELAATLRTIAEHGITPFHEGALAEAIIATVTGAEGNPGLLAMADLAGYAVIERPAVCAPYRTFEVCGMGPPSSGALTVGQMLMMLDPFELENMAPDDPAAWHLIAEAGKLAFADRGLYMADSDFVTVPAGLLDAGYLADRSGRIDPATAAETPMAAGEPPWREGRLAPHIGLDLPGTSHVSIIDAAGNAVSLTTTIESGFGSNLMVGGFLLNNELTDFSFLPERDGVPIANRVEPGKRPRSSMSPSIVYDGAEPVLILGSPGGSRIIGYVAATIIGVLDWGLDVRAAIALPHVVNRNGGTDLEAGTEAEKFAAALEALGHEVTVRDLNSGLHGIEILAANALRGGADPRREGIVLGD